MSATSPIDPSIIEEAKEMMKDKFPMLVEFFIEDTHDYLSEIHKSMETKNIEQMIRPAQSIKSSSKQVGAVELSKIAEELEKLTKQLKDSDAGELTRVSETLSRLDKAFEEVKPHLQKLIS